MWGNQDFDQSGFGQGGGFNTPQPDEKKREARRASNLIPVTIAQILTAKHDDDAFISGNQELSEVTFVGVIKSVAESPTRIDYVIDDMTAPPIEVKLFNSRDDGDEDESKAAGSNAIPENTYVRVHGRVRAFGGKRSVNSHKLSPITDMNELTCHILEVIHTSVKSSQTQSNQSAPSIFGGQENKTATSGGNDHGQIPGLTPLQSQVHNMIRSNQSERGCGVEEICKSLSSASSRAIRDAVEFLSCEGHIYSTIDDEHFQATDV